MRLPQLFVIELLNSPIKTVLNLVLSSALHSFFYLFPVFAVLVNQINQFDILFHGPFALIDSWSQKILVAILDLASVSICDYIRITFEKLCYLNPVLSHLIHIINKIFVVFFEPMIFCAGGDPSVTTIAHLFISLWYFVRNLNPIHFIFIS